MGSRDLRTICRQVGTVVTATLAVTLAGCASPGTAVSPSSTPSGIQTPTLRANDILLIDRFTQRFVAYNNESHSALGTSTESNWVVYDFPTPSNLVSTGNSLRNGYKIERADPTGVTTVYKAEPRQGVFPLVQSSGRSFFTVSRYAADNSEQHRTLGELVDGRLRTFENISGLIDSAAVVGSTFYYSVVDSDGAAHSLWRVPFSDLSSQPVHVESDLTSGRLASLDGKLLTADKEGYRNDSGQTWPCADQCYFDDARHLFLRLGVNASSDLQLDALDARTLQKIGSFSPFVGFVPKKDGIELYLEGKTKLLKPAS